MLLMKFEARNSCVVTLCTLRATAEPGLPPLSPPPRDWPPQPQRWRPPFSRRLSLRGGASCRFRFRCPCCRQEVKGPRTAMWRNLLVRGPVPRAGLRGGKGSGDWGGGVGGRPAACGAELRAGAVGGGLWAPLRSVCRQVLGLGYGRTSTEGAGGLPCWFGWRWWLFLLLFLLRFRLNFKRNGFYTTVDITESFHCF